MLTGTRHATHDCHLLRFLQLKRAAQRAAQGKAAACARLPQPQPMWIHLLAAAASDLEGVRASPTGSTCLAVAEHPEAVPGRRHLTLWPEKHLLLLLLLLPPRVPYWQLCCHTCSLLSNPASVCGWQAASAAGCNQTARLLRGQPSSLLPAVQPWRDNLLIHWEAACCCCCCCCRHLSGTSTWCYPGRQQGDSQHCCCCCSDRCC